MRVLLVQPPFDPGSAKLSAVGMAEPLGMEYLAGAICDQHDVRIIDLRVRGTLREAMEAFDPELVGTTAVTAGLRTALSLLREAKSLSPACTTVIGGVHPTLRPQDCQVDAVDFVVRGDGEQTLRELTRCLATGGDPGAVFGLCYRDGENWRSTADRSLPALDSYPIPARALTDGYRQAYQRVGLGPIVAAISSRGCSRRCTFCSVWRFHHGKYRKRAADAVVEELSARSEPNIDFVDDDSFADAHYMEALRQAAVAQLGQRAFKFYVRADAVVKDPELFFRWREAGLKHVLVGLESFSDRELRDINKRADATQNARAIEILRQAGIGVIGYLIVRPDYQVADFDRLVADVERYQIDQPFFGTLTPFPGTVLFDKLQDQLVTRNWEHFDGFRSVLPTALRRPEYYHQLANLYRRTYGRRAPRGPIAGEPWYEQLAQTIETIESSPGPRDRREPGVPDDRTLGAL